MAVAALKPYLRGWLHLVAAVLSIFMTIAMAWISWADFPRFITLMIFGFSMVELYSVSALFHIGSWSPASRKFLRSLDHANIFFMIAGTYTPICFNLLQGWVRVAILAAIWLLFLAGLVLSFFTHRVPRWFRIGLYIGMGWVSLFTLPSLPAALPWEGIGMLLLGGVFYTVGAVIYGTKKPNPFPRFFGFHEVFHLFVVAGGLTYTAAIWIWVLPGRPV